MSFSNLRIVGLSNSKLFYAVSVIVGVTITYGFSIESDPLEALIQGAIWGFFVGGSLAPPIDARRFREHKWNAIGWCVVAVVYGYWLTFQYEGDPDGSLREAVYWRVLAWSIASMLLGWALLGSFLLVKLGRR